MKKLVTLISMLVFTSSVLAVQTGSSEISMITVSPEGVYYKSKSTSWTEALPCVTKNWIFIDKAQENYKEILSAALAAKATNKLVEFDVRRCMLGDGDNKYLYGYGITLYE